MLLLRATTALICLKVAVDAASVPRSTDGSLLVDEYYSRASQHSGIRGDIEVSDLEAFSAAGTRSSIPTTAPCKADHAHCELQGRTPRSESPDRHLAVGHGQRPRPPTTRGAFHAATTSHSPVVPTASPVHSRQTASGSSAQLVAAHASTCTQGSSLNSPVVRILLAVICVLAVLLIVVTVFVVLLARKLRRREAQKIQAATGTLDTSEVLAAGPGPSILPSVLPSSYQPPRSDHIYIVDETPLMVVDDRSTHSRRSSVSSVVPDPDMSDGDDDCCCVDCCVCCTGLCDVVGDLFN